MDKRTRTYRLYKAGLEASGISPDSELAPLVAAVAGIVDALHKTESQKKGKNFRYDPTAVAFLDTLLQFAGDSIKQTPFDQQWYRITEWRLRDTELTISDAEIVGNYLANGGWKGQTPTVKQVLSWLTDLLNQAGKTDDHDPRFAV